MTPRSRFLFVVLPGNKLAHAENDDVGSWTACIMAEARKPIPGTKISKQKILCKQSLKLDSLKDRYGVYERSHPRHVGEECNVSG